MAWKLCQPSGPLEMETSHHARMMAPTDRPTPSCDGRWRSHSDRPAVDSQMGGKRARDRDRSLRIVRHGGRPSGSTSGAELGGSAPVNRAFSGSAIALERGLRQIPRLGQNGRLDFEHKGLGRSGHAGSRRGRHRAGDGHSQPAVAVGCGFGTASLIFYDTGAYVLEGLGHVFLVERAPVYAELLFLAGGAFSLWPIVVLQALMTSYIILEVARCEVSGLTLWGLLAIGAALNLFTGIGWYVGKSSRTSSRLW